MSRARQAKDADGSAATAAPEADEAAGIASPEKSPCEDAAEAPTEDAAEGGATAEDQTTEPEHPATVGHGHSADDACSVQWDRDGTSAFGTAATARFFVAVEQPGPWGRDAARESHLDTELAVELDARCARAGGRFMLIRKPGPHSERPGPRRVLVANAAEHPAQSWLVATDKEHLGDLLGLDWGALARGSKALVMASLTGSRVADPTLLVCTNGRRDVCCAVRGRPVAASAAALAPERVWEVSHTGGHRFAPTGVLLPWGQTYARLDEKTAGWVLGASMDGHTPVELLGGTHDRGRSGLPPASQCAESTVRASIAETRLAALAAGPPTPSGDGHEVTVTHVDGRTWLVRVVRAPKGAQRPESCGKTAIEVLEYRGEIVEGPEPQ